MFRIKLLLLGVFPLLSIGADRVVLKNGDTITGSVVKKDGAKLTLHSEFLGEVSMPWEAVKSLTSEETLTVALRDGETVSGKVATRGEDLDVVSETGTRSAPMTQVRTLRNPAEQHSWERIQHPGLLELWTGFFDIGLSFARGNARTDTLTTGFSATRVTRNDKVSVTLNQIYGTARVNGAASAIASAIRGGWAYNRHVTPRLFLSTLNEYEHDRFQNLDLRFVAGGGFGANAIKTEKANLAFTGGGDYNRENFTDRRSRDSGELNFGDDFLYKFSPVTNVTQAFRIFPNLTNTGEFRMNLDIGAVTALNKWLGWHLTASDRYISNPLSGHQRNDLLLSTGFRVSFEK